MKIKDIGRVVTGKSSISWLVNDIPRRKYSVYFNLLIYTVIT